MRRYRRPAGPAEPSFTPGGRNDVIFSNLSNSGVAGHGREGSKGAMPLAAVVTFWFLGLKMSRVERNSLPEFSFVFANWKTWQRGRNPRARPDILLPTIPAWRCLVFIDSWGKYLALVAECSTALSSKLQTLSRTRRCCTGSMKAMCQSEFAITAVGCVCKQKW